MERTPDGAAGSAARGTLLASIVGAARLLAGSQPGAPVPGRNLPALVEILRVAAWLAVRISAPDASPTPIFSYPSSDATSDASHTLKKPVPVDVALLTARLAHAAQVVVSAERAALSATPESPVHVAFDPPEPLTVLCADPSALAFAILYVLTDAASHVRGGEVVSVRLASRRTSGRSSGSSTPCSAGGDLLQVTVTASIPSASLTIRDDVEDAGARSRKLAAAAALVAPAAIGLLSLSSSSSMSREEDEDDDSYPATGEARMTLFATLPPKIHRPELHPRAHTEHIHPPLGFPHPAPPPYRLLRHPPTQPSHMQSMIIKSPCLHVLIPAFPAYPTPAQRDQQERYPLPPLHQLPL